MVHLENQFQTHLEYGGYDRLDLSHVTLTSTIIFKMAYLEYCSQSVTKEAEYIENNKCFLCFHPVIETQKV